MNINRIDHAIGEAERFILKARQAKSRLVREGKYSTGGYRETASCKRASMDLTMALAELRK